VRLRGLSRGAIATALLVAAALLARAGIPKPAFVTPDHGGDRRPADVVIHGTAFEPGARVSLAGGGPFLAASYILPEGARSVEVTGDHACVAFYSHTSKLGGIEILDVADPSHPRRVGAFETGDSGVGVQVSGRYAYVAFLNPYTYLGGMHVVDMSDPTDPVRAGTFYTLTDPQAIALSGRYAYVADGLEGLKILDVSDPAAPFEAGRLATPGMARGVAVSGSHVYLAAADGGLMILDATDPAAVVVDSVFAPAGVAASGVAVAGGLAYVSDLTAGLLVLDVGDPGRPLLLGKTRIADTATAVAYDAGLAYVAGGYSGLQVVDVGDPAHPRVVGSQGLFGNSAYFYTVALSPGHAWVADLINGLHVIDVGTPAGPVPEGAMELAGDATGVAVSGDSAFVAGGESGLAVLDVSDPASPRALAVVDTPGSAQDVAPVFAAGRVSLLVADGTAGLEVIGLPAPGGPADPADPASYPILARLDTAGEAGGVAVAGDHAYVADGSRGLVVADVRDPMSPVTAGTWDSPGSARGVAVAGSLVFLADDFSGLEILDASDPSSPLLLGRLDTPGRALSVAVQGDVAYVADLNRGVQVIDISDPAHPALVESLGTEGGAGGVAVRAGRLFIADGFNGLIEMDITDPRHPRPAGVYDTPGDARAAAIAGNRVYVADGGGGLQVIRPNPPVPEPSAITTESIEVTLPAGLSAGAYDVVVTHPAGETESLPNGYAVCHEATLTARLTPDRPAPAGPALAARPASWTLMLDGDAALFAPQPEHSALLLLPWTPAAPSIRYASGREAIELRRDTKGDEVRLIGADRNRMTALWREMTANGGVTLARRDERSYSALSLALSPAGPGDASPDEGGTRRVRYEFRDQSGQLTLATARAWGASADLIFSARAGGPGFCDDALATVSFRDTVLSAGTTSSGPVFRSGPALSPRAGAP